MRKMLPGNAGHRYPEDSHRDIHREKRLHVRVPRHAACPATFDAVRSIRKQVSPAWSSLPYRTLFHNLLRSHSTIRARISGVSI